MNRLDVATVPFGDALRFWWRLGCVSFGGPAAQIAMLHEEVVVRRRWVPDHRFDHALNFCILLPGPEAQQLATYVGWLLHGTRGGIAAGILFVLPAAILLFVLSWLYAVFGTAPAAAGVMVGAKAVVLALVCMAVRRYAQRGLRSRWHVAIAALAFGELQFGVAFPWIIVAAAGLGLTLVDEPSNAVAQTVVLPTRSPRWHPWPTLLIASSLWVAPAGLCFWHGGADGLLLQQYLFFTVAAFVTFGGAYTVLAYVTQTAVTQLHWITAMQAIDGLALAETTPGPLIMVLQFVGFMTGWNHPGSDGPLLAATLGAIATTWATFLPSMMFVFVGAPWVERLQDNRFARRAMAGIAAAVVGVLVHLAFVFGKAVLLPGERYASPDWFVLLVATFAFVLLITKRCGVVATIALGCGVGWLRAAWFA